MNTQKYLTECNAALNTINNVGKSLMEEDDSNAEHMKQAITAAQAIRKLRDLFAPKVAPKK